VRDQAADFRDCAFEDYLIQRRWGNDVGVSDTNHRTQSLTRIVVCLRSDSGLKINLSLSTFRWTACRRKAHELFAAWHIAKGGPANLVNNATLTRSDLIKFSN
jgi:hypothetical protein